MGIDGEASGRTSRKSGKRPMMGTADPAARDRASKLDHYPRSGPLDGVATPASTPPPDARLAIAAAQLERTAEIWDAVWPPFRSEFASEGEGMVRADADDLRHAAAVLRRLGKGSGP